MTNETSDPANPGSMTSIGEDDVAFAELGLPNEEAAAKKTRGPSRHDPTKLSVVSKMYDKEDKGYLDPTQQLMRSMDTSNRGFVNNDKVYDMLKESLEMQRTVFNMKRIVIGLVAFIVLLAVAMLGVSFAAATLARDTSVQLDALMTKDGTSYVGTKGKTETYDVGGGGETDRRGLETFEARDGEITKAEFSTISNDVSSTLVRWCGTFCYENVGISKNGMTTSNQGGGTKLHTFREGGMSSGTPIVEITCPSGPPSTPCSVAFLQPCPTCGATQDGATPDCPMDAGGMAGTECFAQEEGESCVHSTTTYCGVESEWSCTCEVDNYGPGDYAWQCATPTSSMLPPDHCTAGDLGNCDNGATSCDETSGDGYCCYN